MNVERSTGKQISGLKSNELAFLEDLACTDDSSVWPYLNNGVLTGLEESVVFGDSFYLNETQMQEIEDLEKEAKSLNTERVRPHDAIFMQLRHGLAVGFTV